MKYILKKNWESLDNWVPFKFKEMDEIDENLSEKEHKKLHELVMKYSLLILIFFAIPFSYFSTKLSNNDIQWHFSYLFILIPYFMFLIFGFIKIRRKYCNFLYNSDYAKKKMSGINQIKSSNNN